MNTKIGCKLKDWPKCFIFPPGAGTTVLRFESLFGLTKWYEDAHLRSVCGFLDEMRFSAEPSPNQILNTLISDIFSAYVSFISSRDDQ